MPRITVTVEDKHIEFIDDHTEYDSRSEAIREIINRNEDLEEDVKRYESRIEELEKSHTEKVKTIREEYEKRLQDLEREYEEKIEKLEGKIDQKDQTIHNLSSQLQQSREVQKRDSFVSKIKKLIKP